MKVIRLLYRALLMTGCLVFHITVIVVPGIFTGRNIGYSLSVSRLWLGWAMYQMGVRIDVHGTPPSGNHIYVGNHRSYLDGIIAMSHIRSLPVVKAEVGEWPLVGYGAKLVGVIFVKREDKASRTATLEGIKETIAQGHSVVLYPEGTTHLEPTTIDFFIGGFRLAAQNGLSIVPMAMDFADLGDAFIGDEKFIPNFIRCFGKKRCYVKVRYGQPIASDDIDYLVRESKTWIDDNMRIIRKEFEAEKTSKAHPAFAS